MFSAAFRPRSVGLFLFLSMFTCASLAMGMFGNSDVHDAKLSVPITDNSGHAWALQGHICLPDGVHKPRLVIINHGSPPSAFDRPGMLLAGCHSESVQWFLHRHYAVVLLLRLGYGATGGPWTEGYGGCENADYYQAGMETARQLKTMVDFLTALPEVNPDGVIVIGQSAGGWGTLAYDSIPHPHVAAFINMAGGRGGHYHNKPNSNCHPEQLVAAASRFGKTATTPMLWIAAKNDSYFNPSLASAMSQAFNQAGDKAEFKTVEAFGDDGHHLFFGRGGSRIWGPLVDAFIKAIPDATQK